MIVDRGIIEHILADPAILSALPHLKRFAARSNTACCGRGQANRKSASTIRQVKVSLMGLPPAQMTKLKELLNVDSLTFHYPKGTSIASKHR